MSLSQSKSDVVLACFSRSLATYLCPIVNAVVLPVCESLSFRTGRSRRSVSGESVADSINTLMTSYDDVTRQGIEGKSIRCAAQLRFS